MKETRPELLGLRTIEGKIVLFRWVPDSTRITLQVSEYTEVTLDQIEIDELYDWLGAMRS